MSKAVEYVISLRDLLSQGLLKAETHAKKLEGTLHSVNHTALHMAEGMGMSLALFKGVDFIEKSVHAFHELHKEEALLENTMANVGNRAGITSEQMIDFAKRTAQTIPLTTTQILQMEGAVARFNITSKETFDKVISLSSNMAVATGRDGKELASALGMIFENPMVAMRKLMQFDIKFNNAQQTMIAHLVRTGQAAKAQELIFSSLAQRGYGDAAKAAAMADPLFRLNKAMDSMKLSIGEAFTAIMKKLMPAFNFLAGAIQDSIAWMREHKELMGLIGSVLGTVAGAIFVVAAATKIWTAIQWALNAALFANPITWIIAGLIAAAAAVIYCYNHFAKFRAVLMGVWGVIKEFGRIVTDIFMGIWHVIHGVFSFSPSEIKKGYSQAADAMYESGTRMAHAYKEGFDSGMADFAKDHQESATKMNLVTPPKKIKGLGAFGDLKGPDKPISKGTGQKNVHIDIKIGALISGGFQVHTTNIKESYEKVRDHVTSVLMSAINDSQIVSEK